MHFSHLFYEPVDTVYFSVSFIFIELQSTSERASYFKETMFPISYKGIQEVQSLRISHQFFRLRI